MKYIASCSFGKDSLATIILAYFHNEPLDEIVYARVMFDQNTSAEIPEHEEFIHKTAIPLLRYLGYKVTIVQSDYTFLDCFFRVRCKGANVGKYVGFPIPGRCDVQRDCKLKAIRKYKEEHAGEEVTQYIGIALDEPERLARLGKDQISLLAKYGVTEAGAEFICKMFGLYSPIYKFTRRGGCFFCPNQSLKELRHLKNNHPDLWHRLLELSKVPNKASLKYNRTYTFEEIDRLITTKEAKQ